MRRSREKINGSAGPSAWVVLALRRLDDFFQSLFSRTFREEL